MYLTVLGLQWGDEGKGKIVDFLASRADAIVRFAGGPNAGHRVVKHGKTYNFHLLPSGILNEKATVAIGNNVVIDSEQLFKEIAEVEASGISTKGRVFIAERAHIILPEYRSEDKKREVTRKHPIGTTGRGIGIAYAHKATRTGIRVIDMFSSHFLSEYDSKVREYIEKQAERIRPLLIDISEYIDTYASKNILLEGAQGSLLDVDLGTYPYVTSTSTGIAGALVGMGRGPGPELKSLGVLKMYSTRVGHGPFPTEFREDEKELLQHIREAGFEYGVTTGRPRRCGYLDLVSLKYACRINNVQSLALTHADVYDNEERIGFCTAYKTKNGLITRFPASLDVLEQVDIELEYLEGWKQDVSDIQSFNKLPAQLHKCIEFIEEYVGVPVDILSVGPANEQTILRKPVWE